ncbi:Alpha/Beta hydrolase protein [Neohortaea acidophila]|uniref:Alpha/Beta hydrolase protein n=1 Tax=Neohortaea acidophila TaxID=245834 RepID=A0A6A6PIY2_9PEZI|nr:Alpha/Beta hydrolase protein [Neohortaea acidophila]KAF2479493.1 Alpha/Beta hydrolase protein [Neohortaea acidophila]
MHVQTTDSNPFLTPGEAMGEEVYEEDEDDSSNPSSRRPSRHPYARYNSNTSNNSTSRPPPEPRRHSRINLLTPPKSPIPNAPLIICLHGSNDSCMRSWLSFIEVLYKSGHRVLLYDRPTPSIHGGSGADLKPHRAVSELCSYLYSMELRGPFVFVAHSYGGCIARLFLQQKPREVAAMVLVETGQETALAPQVEEEQYRRQILGDAPLSVVRGNTLRRKQDEWVKAAAMARSEAQKAQLEPQRHMLERWEAEDIRLKQKQLQLSRRSRFCQVPNVGHHVIRDRPEAVVDEVKWVMQEIAASGVTMAQRPMLHTSRPSYSMGYGSGGITRSVSNAGAGLKRGLSQSLKRTFSKKGGKTAV